LRHRMLPRQGIRRSNCSTTAIPAFVTCTVTGLVEPSVVGISARFDEVSWLSPVFSGALRCSLFHQWPRRNDALECRAPKNTDQVIEHRCGSRRPLRERPDRTAFPGHSRDVRFAPTSGRRQLGRSRRLSATKRRKSRKIRDSEADLSRPGKKNCGCEHEGAGDNQQQRTPAHRHTDSYPIRKLLLTDARRASIVSCMANHSPHLDNVFSALADPTRRAIIGRLSQGEASVGELARPFDMALPSLMKHIRVLETGGLVESEKHGRVRTCRELARRAARHLGSPP
jgi:DNA-binding transcriptional ArsR family regulator